ncbi:MAG: catalase-peroxidase, partial [Halioglobus sp.]
MLKRTMPMVAAIAITLSPLLGSSALAVQAQPKTNQYWWPEQLDLSPLRQHASESNPMGENFNYAEAFNSLDMKILKADIEALMTTSQDWWPSDYGNYGPFFI